MNWPSALCNRAIPPRRKVKRAPESRAPVSKSMPRAGAMSACSLGAKSKSRGLPQRLTSTFSSSLAPSGTSAPGRLGMISNAAFNSSASLSARASIAGISSLSAATSAFSASAASLSPLPMAAPISLDASLRRDCATCTCVVTARRSSSSAIRLVACAGNPRRAKPASKASGFSRIRRISCMGRAMPARAGQGKRGLRHRSACTADATCYGTVSGASRL